MNCNNKTVSVVIPVYNAEKHLRFCLNSIVSQTYKDLEIILIDDGSTDNSAEIIKEYEKEYTNIKYFRKENGGVASARNFGLKMATGFYVAFSDNDDYMKPDCIANFVKNADDFDIIIGGYDRVSYDGKIMFSRKLENKELSPYVQLACWGKLFKRSFLIDNNIEFIDVSVGEDLYFSCLCYDKTDRIKVLPSTDYHWMYNDLSASNTSQKGIESVYSAIDTLNIIKQTISDKNKLKTDYFFVRALIFYLLFSCKRAEKSQLYECCDKAFDWIKINTDKHNKYFSVFSNNGEVASVKAVIVIFNFLIKTRLAKLALLLYSRV